MIAIALTEKDKKATVNELIKTINILSDQSDLISIVNSFDDTLTDEEFLVQIQEWNNTNR